MKHFQARQLPTHLGTSGWGAILPAPVPDAVLKDKLSADFVIIGGGFAGLAAARRLTQLAPGARIVLLEAARMAEGGAGRNSGFMIDLPHELTSEDYAGSSDDRTLIRLNRQAQAFASAAVDEYGIDPNFFDPAGKVNGAASSRAHERNVSYARHLATLDEPSELLDAQQMAALTGSRHYLSGLYTPGTVMLQPAGFIRGMAAGLSAQGVSLFENSPVTGFRREGERWIVSTPTAQVTASRIILAVNGHLESFGFQRGKLMQLFLFASMTRELDADALTKLGGENRWGITPSDPMGTTMRRIDTGQGGNRIITRTCSVLRSGLKAGAGDLERARTVMRSKFDRRFPQLAGMPMEYSWAGHLCLTLNGVSVMGEIAEGVFSACVQNGLGAARGTLTGMGAAELACGVTSDITRHFTGAASPRQLPPQLIRDVGANAVIRWKEWLAAEE